MEPKMQFYSGPIMQISSNDTLDEFLPRLGPLEIKSCRRILPVLDFGCYAGETTTMVLSPKLPPSIGVFASDPNTKKLADAANHCFGSNIQFCHFDIDQQDHHKTLIWKHKPYAKVFSFNSLQWVRRMRDAFQIIYKLLVMKGAALITMMAHSDLFSVYREMAASSYWACYLQDVEVHVPTFQDTEPVSEAEWMLHDVGFLIETCETRQNALVFTEEQELKGFLYNVNPFVQRIPQDKKENFMDELINLCHSCSAFTVEYSEESGRNIYKLHYLELVIHVQKP